MRKLNIGLIVLGFTVLIVLMVALLAKDNKTIKLTTFEKAYNYTSLYQDSEIMNMTFLINSKDLYITKESSFRECFISDYDYSNQLKITLEQISFINESFEISHEMYYLYEFIFTIDTRTESDFTLEIERAYLNLETKFDEVLKILIGSFCLYKVKEFGSEDLVVANLKGIVNDVDNFKRLVAVDIGLRNNCNVKINIVEIEFLDINICGSSTNTIISTNQNYQSSTSLNQILGYEYDIFQREAIETHFCQLDADESMKLLIPLKYNQDINLYQFGIKIIYQIDNQVYNLYIDDFLFFETFEFTTEQISKLNIYTYENH